MTLNRTAIFWGQIYGIWGLGESLEKEHILKVKHHEWSRVCSFWLNELFCCSNEETVCNEQTVCNEFASHGQLLSIAEYYVNVYVNN